MTDLEMFDCFLYYLDERTPIGKKQRLGKNEVQLKSFLL